jgi:hypothetical protein
MRGGKSSGKAEDRSEYGKSERSPEHLVYPSRWGRDM